MSFFYSFYFSRSSNHGTRMSWKDETAKARARDQGSLEVKGNTAMSMPVLKNLIKHLKLYSPTAHWCRSNMLLNLLMTRVSSVVSARCAQEQSVVFVPELSPDTGRYPPPVGLVHHLFAKTNRDSAYRITQDPNRHLDIGYKWNYILPGVRAAHIFEAKNLELFSASSESNAISWVSEELKRWCQATGATYARGAMCWQDKWRFVSYAIKRGYGEFKYTDDIEFNLGTSHEDVEALLGLLLDMVENTEIEHFEYFTEAR